MLHPTMLGDVGPTCWLLSTNVKHPNFECHVTSLCQGLRRSIYLRFLDFATYKAKKPSPSLDLLQLNNSSIKEPGL